MFTSIGKIFVNPDLVQIEAHCLAADEKPTEGIANGSTCIEMDTSTLYFFDQTNKVWRAWS